MTARSASSTALAFAVILMLAQGIGTASARNLSTTNQNIRVTWAAFESRSSVRTVRCPVTLEGSFHTRTIAKITGSLVGAVTRAIFGQAACTNGNSSAFNGTERYNGTTAPNTLPWHLTYEGFTGTLPNIDTMKILLSRFRFGTEDGGGLCAAQFGATTDNITAAALRDIATGSLNSIEPVVGSNIATVIRRDRDFGGFSCPSSASLAGASTSLTVLSSTNRITITLI